MKIPTLLTALFLCICFSTTNAQVATTPADALTAVKKNITKTNILFGPVFKTIHAAQERMITDRISIQTIAKVRIPRSFNGSRFTTIDANGYTYDPFKDCKLTGFGNITELRFYGKKKGALHGLYGGPFVSFMHYKIVSGTFYGQFTDKNGITYKADLTQIVRINNTGAGLEFGVQGFYKNGFCIDWTILGLGISGLGLKGTLQASNTSANFDFRNYTDDLDKVTLGMDKYLPVLKNLNKESVSLRVGTPWVIFRTGLYIGFGY